MDDQDLHRMASNNPAMTIPASSVLSRYHYSHTQPRKPRLNQDQDHDKIEDKTLTPSNSTSSTQTQLPNIPPNTTSNTNAKPTTTHHNISKHEIGWRRITRNFSPSWFSTTMGTGIVSILLITIPFQTPTLYWLSVIFFILNALLFTASFLISLLRYTLYPEIWTVMINDPTNSLFLGTIPMGFATLVEAWLLLVPATWGHWTITLAWALWIVDAVAACAVTVSLMFLLISESHQQQLDRITAAQLLPIAATIVASGVGVLVAEHLIAVDPGRALATLLASYVLWGMATPFAMTVLVMYYQRLALHKLPPREIIVSSFLPLGPLGMGGHAIFSAGKVAREVLPLVTVLEDIPLAGDMLYIFGLLLALLMWGFGLVWLSFALATIYSCRPFPFNMGWWGFTFPLGVFAVSTIGFGVELPSLFFRVLGTVFSGCVILLWCVVAVGTVRGGWNGRLFNAPCLRNLERKGEEDGRGAEVEEVGVDVDVDLERGVGGK